MHARAAHIVAGPGVGLDLFLHFCLFGIGHAVKVFGKVAFYIVVNGIQHCVDCIRMTERSVVSILVPGFPQAVDAVIYRNSHYVHRNTCRADAHTGHGRLNLPLCPRVHGQRILCFYRTVVYNCTHRIVERVHIHAYADAGFQASRAGSGGVFHFKSVSCVHIDRVRRQFAACNPAGNFTVNIIHRNTAGDAAAEQAGRHTYGNQLRFQFGAVGSAYGKF